MLLIGFYPKGMEIIIHQKLTNDYTVFTAVFFIDFTKVFDLEKTVILLCLYVLPSAFS